MPVDDQPASDDRAPDPFPPELGTAIALVLGWHDPNRRRLPWRTTRDPYGVLVSEIMSQQTQAERAGQAWNAFIDRFPTVEVLAEAPVGEVIAAWTGLGYNRRAINLHRAAMAIVERHMGLVPDSLDALLALPGVGPYTARAVLAFAFGRDVVPVDTNVARVLARLVGQPLSRPRAQALADAVASCGRGSSTAAAVMDLGASVCRSRDAACDRCPVRAECAWAGGPGPDPAATGAHRPTRQSRFEGSARQARGQLVAALVVGPVTAGHAMDIAGVHGASLLDDLVADGLAVPTPTGFALPGKAGKA